MIIIISLHSKMFKLSDKNWYSFCAGNYNDTGLTKLRFLINLTQTSAVILTNSAAGILCMPAALEFWAVNM